MKNEPKSENGLKKHQKSIRFFTINHMVVRHVAKPYKTNGKSMILETHKPPKVTHKGPPLFLHSSFFILHRMKNEE